MRSSPVLRRTLVLGLVGHLGLTAATAETRVAFVDMERIFQNFYMTVRSDASFQKQKDAYNERAQEMAGEIDKIKKERDELQERSLNIALSDEVRQESRKQAEDRDVSYREKKKDLQEFVGRKDKELGKRYLELREEIVKELTKFIKTYAEREKYDLVLDTSGLTRNYIPVVVYSKKDNDLTDKVLAELNRGHESEIPKPDEKTGKAGKPSLSQGADETPGVRDRDK